MPGRPLSSWCLDRCSAPGSKRRLPALVAATMRPDARSITHAAPCTTSSALSATAAFADRALRGSFAILSHRSTSRQLGAECAASLAALCGAGTARGRGRLGLTRQKTADGLAGLLCVPPGGGVVAGSPPSQLPDFGHIVIDGLVLASYLDHSRAPQTLSCCGCCSRWTGLIQAKALLRFRMRGKDHPAATLANARPSRAPDIGLPP